MINERDSLINVRDWGPGNIVWEDLYEEGLIPNRTVKNWFVFVYYADDVDERFEFQSNEENARLFKRTCLRMMVDVPAFTTIHVIDSVILAYEESRDHEQKGKRSGGFGPVN